MTLQELEAQLGPRGHCFVKRVADGRNLVRRWCRAKGAPSGAVEMATLRELAACYNDTTDAKLASLEADIAARKGEADIAAIAAAVAYRRGEQLPDDDEADAVPPVRAVEAAPKPDGSLESAILALVQGKVKAGLDADEIARLVDKRIAEIAGAIPRTIRVEVADRPAVEMAGQHAIFERVLKLVINGGTVLVVGPAGCGKTYLGEQIAKALSKSYTCVSGSAGVSESAITGWLLPVNGGAFEYQPSEFVRLYETGNALIQLDEIDAFDPNMLMVANVPLANGKMHVPHRRNATTVVRGADVTMFASANTFGFGADRIYAGRNQLDGATLDRFIVVEMDYDRGLETRIGMAGGLSAGEMADIWRLRDKVNEHKLARIVSTRAFQKAGILKAAGDDWPVVMSTLTSGWSRDELGKVGREVRP